MARPFIVDPGAAGGDKAMMAMVMELLGGGEERHGKGRRLAQEEQALAERQQRAAEMYQQGQLSVGQESNRLAREQFEAGQKELESARTERTTKEVQSRMDAAQKAAEELRKEETKTAFEREKLGSSEFEKLLGERAFDVTDKGETTMAAKLFYGRHPEYAKIAQDLKEQESAAGLEKGLSEFRAMTPKQRAAVAKDPTLVGGPEVLKRLQQQIESEPAPAAEPGMLDKLKALVGQSSAPPGPASPAATAAPSERRGYGAVPGGVAGNPLTEVLGLQDPFRYMRAPQPQPAPSPTASTGFEYQEGYPSAQPNYMSGIQTPLPMDVINRIEGDPRYQSAEVNMLNALKNWWRNPETPENTAGIGWNQ